MVEISTAGIFQIAFIARHARGGLGLQGKWRTRACIPHMPYMRATACLTPTATPSSLPWERARERATSRQGLYFERLGYWERLPPFGECPLPSPPPQGREQVAADSSVAGRLKKNARNINSRNFSGSLLSQGRCNKRRKRFFRRPLNPSVGCVPQGTHAVG